MKKMEFTKVVMTLWIRLKKFVKSAIILNSEDVERDVKG